MLMFPNDMMSVYTLGTPALTENFNTVIHWLLYVPSSSEIRQVLVGGKPTPFKGKFALKKK